MSVLYIQKLSVFDYVQHTHKTAIKQCLSFLINMCVLHLCSRKYLIFVLFQ